MLNVTQLLAGKARLVAHVTRFAGTPVHRRETVAEHSYMTAQYTYFIGMHCLALGGAVDMGRLLSRAIVHDLDEAVMVDLPRPIKYADKQLLERWTQLCHSVINEMGADLGVDFFTTWLYAKDKSLEGAIVALADLISVTAYAIEEIRFGNTFMRDVLQGNIAYLEKFLDMNPPAALRALTIDTIAIATDYL